MWDIKSVILYLVMASIGYFCISEERRSIQNGVRRRLKVSYAILFFVWLFLAVYRYVGYESGIIIGGNDAPTYIDYFQTCLAGKGNNIYSEKLQKAESAGKAHCLYLWTRTLLAQG